MSHSRSLSTQAASALRLLSLCLQVGYVGLACTMLTRERKKCDTNASVTSKRLQRGDIPFSYDRSDQTSERRSRGIRKNTTW
ncbi:hypothetical protein F5X68DRAFT_71135 [Plectosphaerella plurivora]|uniref:Secreted protein n=1 Tax=Plectosphaerella plurivora TaxID=936078 RepID=A0A9P8VHX4_9PEZI|nr:hypothetical protein F5X68DRAFT_71135 [Plectosphaerella plurivora]